MESKNKVFVVIRTVDFKAQEEERAAAKLPEMERLLIAEFAERCKMGFKEYGPVYLGKRNWGKELKEEALDGLFYALMAAKTMEKYGNFIKALEEASDDDLSMDACSPDPLKQAAFLVKKYASELEVLERSFAEIERQRDNAESQAEDLSERIVPALNRELGELRKDLAALANELGMTRQVRNNYKESYEKLRKENLDMRAAMEAALSLGSPRA